MLLRKKTAEVADRIKTEVGNAGRVVTAIGIVAGLALLLAAVALIVGLR